MRGSARTAPGAWPEDELETTMNLQSSIVKTFIRQYRVRYRLMKSRLMKPL